MFWFFKIYTSLQHFKNKVYKVFDKEVDCWELKLDLHVCGDVSTHM